MHTSRPVPALELIRRRAAAHGVSAGEIDEMQDLTWEWATASATAVHRVLQERAMAGAAHRADFLRSLVDGTVAPAVLRAEARNHGLDPEHRYRIACAAWNGTAVATDLLAALRARGSTARLPVVDTALTSIWSPCCHAPRTRCPRAAWSPWDRRCCSVTPRRRIGRRVRSRDSPRQIGPGRSRVAGSAAAARGGRGHCATARRQAPGAAAQPQRRRGDPRHRRDLPRLRPAHRRHGGHAGSAPQYRPQSAHALR